VCVGLSFFLLAPEVYALQQTGGELVINVTQGSSGSAKYGLKNDENKTITVNLGAEGEAASFLELPKELTLAPNEFTYVEVKASMPKDYAGAKELNGLVYALREGEKRGQVQLNVKLGKRVKVIVNEAEPENAPETEAPKIVSKPFSLEKNPLLILVIGIFMGVVVLGAGALIYKKIKWR